MLFQRLFARTRIDRLAAQKKELVLKRDKVQRDMRNRNSKRETKITILENKSQTDYENTQKKVIELDRQIDKAIRALSSEQIYVNEVADSEKNEHLRAVEEEKQKKAYKAVK